MKSINRYKRIKVWFKRIYHRKGFGIQSPSSFKFVSEIVTKQINCEELRALQKEQPQKRGLKRKLLTLCFRISNKYKPQNIVVVSEHYHDFHRYIKAGNTQAEIYSNVKNVSGDIDLLYLSACNNAENIVYEAINKRANKAIFIIEDIKTNEKMEALWQKIINNKDVVITYDLYYCGIITFPKHRYKENYIVNF